MEDWVTRLAEATFIHVNRMEKSPGARLILNIKFTLNRLRERYDQKYLPYNMKNLS